MIVADGDYDDDDEDDDEDEDEDEKEKEEEKEEEGDEDEQQVKEVHPEVFCSFQTCAHPLANMFGFVRFSELRYWQLLTGVKLTQQQLVTRQALVHFGGQAASAMHTKETLVV